jgi:hypothetical protein
MWLWNVADHFTFDIFQRTGQYVPYVSDSQFGPEAERLAQIAVTQLTEFRLNFPSVHETATYLSASAPSTANDCLNSGMAYGLAGKIDSALPLLNRYLAYEDNRKWAIQKRAEIEELVRLPDPQSVQLAIEDRVRASRDALHLPPSGHRVPN